MVFPCSTDSLSGHKSRYSVGQYSVMLEDFEQIALPVLQVHTDKVSQCATEAANQLT